MPAALFAAHATLPAASMISFKVLLYGLVTVVGIGVGLEIPIVMRLLDRHLKGRDSLSTLVSQVLTFDYLGSLVVSVAFPLLLVPHLGIVRSGVFFGLLNTLVAIWSMWLFRAEIPRWKWLGAQCGAIFALLVAAMAAGDLLTTWSEDQFYGPGVVYHESTPYQRIVVTSQAGTLRLFLNGNLQFNSKDEYRYHEALVHPAMAGYGAPRRVLVLGGGDGLAIREILKYPSVEQVTQIELDPAMTRLFTHDPTLSALNQHSLTSPKVRIVNADAFAWLEQHDDQYDVIVVDFPTRATTRWASSTPPASTSSSTSTWPRRLCRRADHLAADRAPQLLDGGHHAGDGRPARGAVPRARAQLRRVGLPDRQPSAVGAAARAAAGHALPHAAGHAGLARTSRPTWRACPPSRTVSRTRRWSERSKRNGGKVHD